jgi:uncharacterized protein (DUF58 family)
VGGTLTETFTVRNRSYLPRLWLELHDDSTLPGHSQGHVLVNLAPRGTQTWHTDTRCTRRGWFRLGPTIIASGDPFGFFEAKRRLAASESVLIYPAMFPVHTFAPAIGRLSGGEASRQRTHFITPNAAGVRDYVPGDSLNRIHWRSTARRNRLTTKEFEMDPLADVWIVLDNAADVHPYSVVPEFSSEEYGVSVAASLARYFIERGRAVGFGTYAPERQWLQADRGPRQLTKMLELLAVTQATGTISLHDLLRLESPRFIRDTTVLLITPSVQPPWIDSVRRLARRAVRVIVVHLDAESFGGAPGTPEILRALYAEHVAAYRVRQGDDLSVVLSQEPART